MTDFKLCRSNSLQTFSNYSQRITRVQSVQDFSSLYSTGQRDYYLARKPYFLNSPYNFNYTYSNTRAPFYSYSPFSSYQRSLSESCGLASSYLTSRFRHNYYYGNGSLHYLQQVFDRPYYRAPTLASPCYRRPYYSSFYYRF